ncbi:Uncharacterized protein conserved in bacteria (DUF2076) [Atlantibacter hermannii]|nr:Uncharacterized protein conserved in bacteria (DUF2076) [Atlantibacter hermannii]
MQSEEQRLIDGLFTRLQQAETQSAPRDADAEARIVHHLQQQPQAPVLYGANDPDSGSRH